MHAGRATASADAERLAAIDGLLAGTRRLPFPHICALPSAVLCQSGCGALYCRRGTASHLHSACVLDTLGASDTLCMCTGAPRARLCLPARCTGTCAPHSLALAAMRCHTHCTRAAARAPRVTVATGVRSSRCCAEAWMLGHCLLCPREPSGVRTSLLAAIPPSCPYFRPFDLGSLTKFEHDRRIFGWLEELHLAQAAAVCSSVLHSSLLQSQHATASLIRCSVSYQQSPPPHTPRTHCSPVPVSEHAHRGTCLRHASAALSGPQGAPHFSSHCPSLPGSPRRALLAPRRRHSSMVHGSRCPPWCLQRRCV
jgi:hypothetical protein